MGGRTSPNAGSPEAMSAAVATFEGTLRAVNKHNLLLEVGEGKTLTLIVDKKTLFRDGDKVLKPAELSPEAKATVEVHKVMGDLVAISVRLRGSDAHSQAAKPEMKHRN